MSEGKAPAVPTQPGNGHRGERSAATPKPAADFLSWPGGTVLPDEMIAQLRETLGALDALLASAEFPDHAAE
jgi:hypothetical protein